MGGLSTGKLIVLGIVALMLLSALTAAGLGINSALRHHYVDPEKAIWDRKENVYLANEQTLKDANGRLTTEFSDLTKEVNEKTAAFETAGQLAKKQYDLDLAKVKTDGARSQPKLDELRRQTKEATPVLEIQAKVHKMLVEYSNDVQKVREMLGLQ